MCSWEERTKLTNHYLSLRIDISFSFFKPPKELLDIEEILNSIWRWTLANAVVLQPILRTFFWAAPKNTNTRCRRVNFINILHSPFAPIFWYLKYNWRKAWQCTFIQKMRKKCWWNYGKDSNNTFIQKSCS